jgi:hypothetical protein
MLWKNRIRAGQRVDVTNGVVWKTGVSLRMSWGLPRS